MSIAALFNIGRSALTANQAALAVTGHNIANAATEGYSRREAILEIASPVVPVAGGFLGSGVSAAGIRRYYDRFVGAQLLGQQGLLGRSRVLDETWSRVETLLGEEGGQGLSAALRNFFAAWQAVAAAPEETAPRIDLLNRGAALAGALARAEQEAAAEAERAAGEIRDVASQVNALAAQVARLNVKIAEIEAGPSKTVAADARDERDRLLEDLCGLVDASVREDRDGAVTVTVGMRNLVSGGTAAALSVESGAAGEPILVLDGIDVTARIEGGRIGGLLAARAQIAQAVLVPLRRLAAALTVEVNALHRTGAGLDGLGGRDFFAPLSVSVRDESTGADAASAVVSDASLLTLDDYEIAFDGTGNYTVRDLSTGGVAASGSWTAGTPIAFDGIEVTVTGAPAPGDRFVVSVLEGAARGFRVVLDDPRAVAAAQDPSGVPGDNANAVRLAELADAALARLGGATVDGWYAGVVADTGFRARTAADTARFDENLLAEIRQRRDALSGVSLDEEAANLVRYQRAFEAGARIIRVTDELLRTVLEL